ncbi:MAG: DEAD/DEAH box helicase [Metamycoplasmataceae bacterium]
MNKNKNDYEENKDIAHSTKNYKKLLNNLLNISINDPCLFSNINNIDSFDIAKKFGNEFFDKVIINEYFLISLKASDVISFINKIREITEVAEISELYKSFNEPIPENIQKMLTAKNIDSLKIESIKKEIIKLAEVNKQKASFNWKILLNRAQTINEQSNLWPLHLGFIYITVKIDNKAIQAPLFFKEINIKIKNSNVSIVSIGNIKINEKLAYYLESNGFLFDIDIDYSKMSIKELYDNIEKSWSQNFTMPSTLSGYAPNFKAEEIENSKIKFWPGITLGFFEPTGGYLRKVMVKIIEEGILDEILDVEFDKNIYKDTIKKTIFKKNFGFYKIQHSNFSQDKAVVSALNQNTIIWGPPGTGKSQTISNIITNILVYDKTAIIASQKKAALEVLRNRMDELGTFCLFVLNDKEMNKKSFYNPIKTYIDFLENFRSDEDQKPIKIISDYEKKFVKLISKIKSSPVGDKNMSLFSWYLSQNEFDIHIFEDLKKLPANLTYDFINLKESPNIAKFLMNKNNLKTSLFIHSTPEVKLATKIIKNNFLDKKINLDNFIKSQEFIDIELLEDINKLHQFNLDKYDDRINDPSKLKNIVGRMIFQKIKKFDNDSKKKYSSFALDVRTSNLEPNQFIKKHADIIKILFPIIISTPETELRSWTRNEFDYAILDESSQIFLEKGIPILYLAKIKILAGDDQQMQPTRWFASKVGGENSFGNIESLLDFAIAKGVYSILLDKNYRSNYASLMTFNSEMFYKGELDVVDINSNMKEIPIDVINAEGVWDESVNRIEIDIAIAQVLENIKKYKKIILLCFNGSQQAQIEKLIFTEYPDIEKAISTNQLLIRNIENIQGDEADLVIMTIVYDKHTKLHSSYVAKPGGKNALNVAISRAKSKMIIIKSIVAEDINNPSGSEDINVFKEWLRFLDLPEELKKSYIKKVKKNLEPTHIELEKQALLHSFYSEIMNGLDNSSGVDIIKNFSIGTIQIDLAIIDKITKNFIQGFLIDNFSYFNSYEDYVVDRDLKNFLLLKKYPVIKINEMNWVINKGKIIHTINAIVNKKQFSKKQLPVDREQI